ncbi:MAG: hypothetical protein M3388_15615 [Acidobacteriota bacterium]|nr:hypothetical protein [Acidobacteriota bacterium]
MKEGDVILVAMPQADGTVKNRPTIVLREMPPFQDILVCGVSTLMLRVISFAPRQLRRSVARAV